MARLAADEVRLAGGGPHAVDIWPTANRLPANILRFYVQFSEPAEAVFDPAQLRLITATSALVPDAFLMLNEELWSPDGRRLTVLMEPGRIKRGMGSDLTHGPALVPGRSYRLEVATGGQVFFKVFGVPPARDGAATGDSMAHEPAAGRISTAARSCVRSSDGQCDHGRRGPSPGSRRRSPCR